MIRLHSSLRTRTPEETFQIASQYAQRFGISRVTETTRLDRVGIPVFTAIRPGASAGSLVVTAGKGMLPAEARVGAIMEAIELAYSEPQHSNTQWVHVRVSEILDHRDYAMDVLDLCPLIGAEIPEDDPIAAVPATDLLTGQVLYVPAELIYIPALPDEPAYFGYHSNGLASGNTREEAVIHGILEVIERDILSFEFVRDSSVSVPVTPAPTPLARVCAAIHQAGLTLQLRTVLNPFGLPFFKAYLVDHDLEDPIYLNAGYGCHPDKDIAAIRAITEALQSRMSFIHGGREDLDAQSDFFAQLDFRDRSRVFNDSVNRVLDQGKVMAYDAIPSLTLSGNDIPEILDQLLTHLHQTSPVRAVLCVFHSTSEEPLQVVKVIIPGLEFYNGDARRIGRRLSAVAKVQAHDHLRRTQS